MGKKKRTRKGKKSKLPRYTTKEVVTARYLSKIYRKALKAHRPYARPWRDDLDITTLPVFAYFVNAARLVRSLEADPRVYIKAQFEYWRNWKHFYYPVPSLLCTQVSIERYNEWLGQHGTAPLRSEKEKRKEQVETRLRRDEMRLKIIHDRVGGSAREILMDDPTAFSQGFLEKHGVWDQVKDIWLEWASNA